ncbi:prepilin peptidase [Desulfitibacter alkalitolerans]|uniref:prepilin peptidase n=1 Tax=Desulfitibacter alkalitolerans TaxID=264641 RepID=UPI0004871EDF|nr:A24 family peptidase [Desulfitibacter alkalitolerans]
MTLLITILGLVIGSFLNVCIYRIPKGKSVIYKPSNCTSCNTNLEILDLIPLISYILLRGKCRYCGEGIKVRYPLVEILTGGIFLITYLYIGFDVLLIKYLVLFSVLIVATFIDLDHQIIPNKLVFLIFTWGIIWQIFYPELFWYQSIGGAILGGGLLFLAAIISRGGMGGGDIKLMFAAGFILGISATALALFLSFLAGSIIGMVLILLRIKGRKDPIPFGPFLSLGIFIAALWGYEIIKLYLKLMF